MGLGIDYIPYRALTQQRIYLFRTRRELDQETDGTGSHLICGGFVKTGYSFWEGPTRDRTEEVV